MSCARRRTRRVPSASGSGGPGRGPSGPRRGPAVGRGCLRADGGSRPPGRDAGSGGPARCVRPRPGARSACGGCAPERCGPDVLRLLQDRPRVRARVPVTPRARPGRVSAAAGQCACQVGGRPALR
ncbi:hypothetical protein C9J60_04945 [Streptomyces sp. A244]|nr:hypothetical protein C9J60_04945 [Streptomyces sp. A244]